MSVKVYYDGGKDCPTCRRTTGFYLLDDGKLKCERCGNIYDGYNELRSGPEGCLGCLIMIGILLMIIFGIFSPLFTK